MSTLVTNCDIINCDSYELYIPGVILLSYGERNESFVVCEVKLERFRI